MTIEALCMILSMSTAVLLIWGVFILSRTLYWHRKYNELLSKPFEFWERRERRRLAHERMMRLTKLNTFAQPKPIPEGGDVVKFRRPIPFDVGKPL